jgi:hypothetical protein
LQLYGSKIINIQSKGENKYRRCIISDSFSVIFFTTFHLRYKIFPLPLLFLISLRVMDALIAKGFKKQAEEVLSGNAF